METLKSEFSQFKSDMKELLSPHMFDQSRTSKHLTISDNSRLLTSASNNGGLSICTDSLQDGEVHTFRIKPLKIGDSYIGL